VAKTTLDCRGLSCPQPVVNTKKALESLEKDSADFTLTVVVDNETALKNVTRFANTSGYRVATQKAGDDFHLTIAKPAAAAGEMQPAANAVNRRKTVPGEATVLLVTASTLGRGEEELGTLLMRSFFYSLKESDVLPGKILFFNTGVYLTTEGSPVLEELQALSDRGVEIFSCGTCLEYYKLKDRLAVGQVTNMYDTVAAMLTANRCITL
jgi:selenium metabolism protein YedF